MFKFLCKFTVFFVFFLMSVITDVWAVGYTCPTYKRYTSCSFGYYMTSSSSSTTCNTTPTAGNACRPCSVAGTGFSCSGGTSCPSKTCPAGYYLPANSSFCTKCPPDYYCVGGTFPKSSSVQGRIACPIRYPSSVSGSDAITDCYASVQAGYYMSSSGKKICPVGTYKGSHTVYYNNTSTCSNCSSGWTDGGPGSTSPEDCRKNIPAGSWFDGYSVKLCPSGKYSEAHYVTSSPSSPSSGCSTCPDDAPFSPTGAEGVAACGRLLHIGDSTLYLRSGKKTTPSLNILIDGKQFYGNLSTSITSQFKIKSGSTTYSLYDDTMD